MAVVLIPEEKKLIRRYLIWCYKTTREQTDKVDRKFTQLMVDYRILAEISKSRNNRKCRKNQGYLNLTQEFKAYILQKQRDAFQQKFADQKKKTLNPTYQYWKDRLKAIENSIKYFLGLKELGKIKSLYEEEMTKRILQSREHT